MCLEEMTGRLVPRGAVFHLATRRHEPVEFDPTLRDEVGEMVGHIRDMLDRVELPPVVADARCRRCSLADSCQPKVIARVTTIAAWDAAVFRLDAREVP
jgi:CRISPR-associated exonuclease Cas4